jgi:hypothetical protein
MPGGAFPSARGLPGGSCGEQLLFMPRFAGFKFVTGSCEGGSREVPDQFGDIVPGVYAPLPDKDPKRKGPKNPPLGDDDLIRCDKGAFASTVPVSFFSGDGVRCRHGSFALSFGEHEPPCRAPRVDALSQSARMIHRFTKTLTPCHSLLTARR